MKVSGNIISELSDRIPSNFMALNELIKNAFDADASTVDINVLTSQKKIIVQDTGCGMDRTGMENLLHIARSNKNYAIRRSNKRIMQGEKGLGALATFHFGNSVTWETSQDSVTAYKFKVLKNEIIEKDDINEYITEIEEIPANFKGTKITISDIQNDEFDFIVNTLKNKKTTSKLIRSLYDSEGFDSFCVSIFIDGKPCVVKADLEVDPNNDRERIYTVTYDSHNTENGIRFFYDDTMVFEESFVLDKSLNDFKIKCNLKIYDLSGKVSSANFPALYQKEQEKPDITPLVYINQGFFKNYTLFDVDVSRKTRSAESLAQITGEIEIQTKSEKLMFNADRTEINENFVTAKLKTEIERLNRTIQKVGSKYKTPFIEMNRGRLPIAIIKNKALDITDKDDNQIKTLVINNIANIVYANLTSYVTSKNNVVYTFFDKRIEIPLHSQKQEGKAEPPKTPPKDKGNTQKPAVISLMENRAIKTIGVTGQLDLYSYIIRKETKDSSGKEIPLEEISISDDKGLMKVPNILPAITSPQEVVITYTYNDFKTGPESKQLIISFVNPKKEPIGSTPKDDWLIHNHGIGGFSVSFDNVAGKLVNQINSLKIEDYSEMIACSLRTLFELGIDAIKNKNSTSINFTNMRNHITPRSVSLEDKVKAVVNFVRQPDYRRHISNYFLGLSYTNVSFDTLKNIANSDRISTNAGESNLGAHKGTKNLSPHQIIDIANSVSAFLIFVEGIIGAADEF